MGGRCGDGQFSSVVEILERRAREIGDQTAFVYTNADGAVVRTDSYAELEARTRAVAATLAGRDLAGERVLLLIASPWDFVPGFLGCLQAGAVAVPVKVPSKSGGF